MKIILLLISVHVICLTRDIEGSAIRAPLDVISLDDISPEERKQLDHLHNKYGRPKRSGSGGGSGDILESLKLAIGQGIKNKIGELAKGSAAATARLSSSSSSSSSGHGYSYHPPPESYDHKSLDFWSLKKSILNTLLQAVKAIKGGVIAVKGQLIKGGGYLTAAAGKLIVTKGDAVTNLGKKIASSAVLVPYHGHPSSHAEYGPPPESHYSAPSAPEDFYHGSPSAPAPDFHDSGHQYPYHDDETPDKGPSGLLVLKKIYGDQHHHQQHYVAEDKTPSFKPIEPSGPSFGTILGKFLSASSSLDPHKPEPFGNTASGDTHSYHSHSHSEPHYEVSETKHHQEVVPSAAGYVMKGESSPEDESFMNEPSDDSPFEKEPSYLGQNFDEYVGSSSIKKPQAVKTNSIPQEEKPSTIQTAGPAKQPQGANYAVPSESSSPSQNFVQNFDYPSLNVQTLGTAPASSTDLKNTYDIYNLPNIGDYPSGFPSQGGLIMPQSSNGELPSSLIGQTSAGQNLYYPSQAPSVIDLTKDYVPPAFDSSAENFVGQQPQLSNEVSNYYNLPSASTYNHPSASSYSHPSASPYNHPSASPYNHPSASPYNHPSSLSHNRPSVSIQSSQGAKQHSPPSVPHTNRRPTRLTHYDSAPSSSSKHRTKSTRPKHSYSTTHKRPSSSTRTRTSKHKPKQTYDVVKSIAYELGPNGPKRLTK